MKYLKKYNIYIESIDIEERILSEDEDTKGHSAEETLNDLKDQISEFNSKKINLENLIMGNVSDKKDITNNIEQIVGDNKFLSMYLSLVNKMASVKKLGNKVEYYKQVSDERKLDLVAVSKLSDEEERRDQTNKLKEELKEISDKSKDIDKRIKEIESNIKDDQKKFKEYIKDKEDQYKDSMKDLKD